MTRLVICRHAEAGNQAQAEDLAARLAAYDLSAVYTSPLERAVATARVIGALHSLVPHEVAALREIDFGTVDGLTFAEYPAALREELLRAPTKARFPGGETYGELQRRVLASVEALIHAHRDETVAVITHAGPIRAALAHWLHIRDGAVFRIEQCFASVNVVDWIDGTPVIRLVNG